MVTTTPYLPQAEIRVPPISFGATSLEGPIGARYGCVIGRTAEPWLDWAHANTWTIDLDEVATAIRQM
jgi:hypothetical protein